MRLKFLSLTTLMLVIALLLVTGASAQGTPAPRATTSPTAEDTPTTSLTPVSATSLTPVSALTPTATHLPAPTRVPRVTATPTQQATPVEQTTVADGGERIELTVYNQNRALVREYRTLQLVAGENEVRYGNVPLQILPASLRMLSLTDPAGTLLLEQAFQYDTANSAAVLSKYIDREITLKLTDGTVYSGTLLSTAGDVMLATTRGLVIAKADQVQEFILPLLPEALVTRPSLLWRLSADQAGENQLRVTYLTGGMNWSADYAAVLSADETALALNSWVTVDNQSGKSYADAKVKLVAGTLNLTSGGQATVGGSKGLQPVAERSLLDYHIYDVPRPITLPNQQSKQIEFIGAPQVAATKVYVYDASPAYTLGVGQVNSDPAFGVQTGTAVQVRLEFSNTVASGLGMPLPAGVVRVYTEDADGAVEFVGEDSIGHTPVDEALSLTLGQAFDVLAERAQTKFRQLAERSIEETTEITLRNQKDEDVVVRVIEHLFRAEDAEVLSSTQNFVELDAHTIQFEVTVVAGGKVTLEYSTRYRW